MMTMMTTAVDAAGAGSAILRVMPKPLGGGAASAEGVPVRAVVTTTMTARRAPAAAPTKVTADGSATPAPTPWPPSGAGQIGANQQGWRSAK
jgi:hypothetical protein